MYSNGKFHQFIIYGQFEFEFEFLTAVFSIFIGHDLDDDHHSIAVVLFLARNITAIFPCDAPRWWGKVPVL